MDIAVTTTVPYPLRATWLTIVRHFARQGYEVDARGGTVIAARTPFCMVSAILKPIHHKTRIVLLARGSWARHHIGAPLPYQEAKAELRRVLDRIVADIPAYVREYFPVERDLDL